MDKLIKNGIAIPSITPGTSAFRTQKILSLYNILQSDLFVIPTLFNTANSRLLILIFVLIGIVFFITRTEIHKLRDKSIIDEIRMDIV